MDYDELLVKHLGEFKKFQIVVCVCLTCFYNFPFTFNIMPIIFQAATPNHWCHTPELDRFNISDEVRWNLTIPLVEKDGVWTYSQCQAYDRNFTGVTYNDLIQEATLDPHAMNQSVINCRNGWQYDQSRYDSTIVTEWDLVCDKQILQATASSVFMAGLMTGAIIFGQLSDWIGRRQAICIGLVITIIVDTVITFSANYLMFIILRFLVAMSSMGVVTTSYVFCVEMVGPSRRLLAGIMGQITWGISIMASAGVAYFFRNWRILQVALTSSLVIFLLGICFLPESARWLYAKQKKEQADKLVRRMAKVNKVQLPDNLDVCVTNESAKASIIDLFRTRRMRLRTINICYNWFVICMVYWGLSLNTSTLVGDPYVNVVIMGFLEIPATFVILALLKWLYRRWCLSGALFIAGLTLMAMSLVPSDLKWISFTLAMVGKFAISVAFSIIWLFTTEVMPTVLRTTGMAAGCSCARVGAVLAPFIFQLSAFGAFIPMIVLGILSLVAGSVVFLLPETKGKDLPETLEDGENYGLEIRRQDKGKTQEQNNENLVTSNLVV